MKRNLLQYLVLCSFISGALLIACTNELEPIMPENPLNDEVTILRAEVSITDMEEASGAPEVEIKTRLSQNIYDHWTWAYSSFTDRDTVGVFSRTGNMNLPTSDGKGGPLFNVPMHFVQQDYPGVKDPVYSMENDTVMIMPTSMTANAIMMYYPYTKNLGSLANYPNWKEYPTTPGNANVVWGNQYPDIPGIELRAMVDGSPRCRDVLIMRNANADDLKKGNLRGTFYHCFAGMVIMRGKGFQNPKRKENDGTLVPDESINVVLNQPYTHFRIVSYSDHVRWTTQCFYQENYEFNGKVMTQDEAKIWPAWKGEKYPNTDKPTEQEGRVDAWYVVFPTVWQTNSTTKTTDPMYPQNTTRPMVTEIQLYDDEGFLQHVTAFNLNTPVDPGGASATKSPYPNYRWAIEIAMDELGPTVRPVSIGNWDKDGDDKDLTEERTAGIHDEGEYNAWVTAYNTYIDQDRNESYAEPLKKFGDLVDGKIWNFYIEEFPVTSSTVLNQVVDLQDQLIGNNNFFNVTFEGLTLTYPLFKKVSVNGGMQNIDFRDIYVTCDKTDPTGIIAGEIVSQYGGSDAVSFTNCHIYNGTLISNGPVGMMAGSIQHGRISDCFFSGFIMGSTSANNQYKNLFGSDPSYLPSVSSTLYSDIIFSLKR